MGKKNPAHGIMPTLGHSPAATLKLLMEGHTLNDIANLRGLSNSVVDTHVKFLKGAADRAAMLRAKADDLDSLHRQYVRCMERRNAYKNRARAVQAGVPV
jgi:glycosyltransferase A (GT-A) superfamily protein (DUF2064 family)